MTTATFWGRLATPSAAACAAVLLRLGISLHLGAWHAPETFESEDIVRNLLAGRGYTYEYLGTVYRSFHSILPYDLLTAAVYGVSGASRSLMLIVQWAFAALLCLVVGRLGHRLGGPAVAGLGAWLAALHPALAVYDATKLQQFGLDALLVALGILAFARWAERPSGRRAVWAGLVSGLLLYQRGTLGLFFPIAALWVRWVGRLSWGRWGRQVGWYLLVAAVVLAPWGVRNVLTHQRVVPMMTTTWMALWKGNHPGATGTEYSREGQPILADASPALRRSLAGASELGQMEAFRAQTLAFLQDRPGEAAALFWRKLRFFWWRSPHTGLRYPPQWSAAYQAWYVTLLVFAVAGGLFVMRAGGPSWALARLLLWLGLAFSVGQSLFYIAGRHRWTIEPMVGLLSAAGCCWAWRRLRERRAVNAQPVA